MVGDILGYSVVWRILFNLPVRFFYRADVLQHIYYFEGLFIILVLRWAAVACYVPLFVLRLAARTGVLVSVLGVFVLPSIAGPTPSRPFLLSA